MRPGATRTARAAIGRRVQKIWKNANWPRWLDAVLSGDVARESAGRGILVAAVVLAAGGLGAFWLGAASERRSQLIGMVLLGTPFLVFELLAFAELRFRAIVSVSGIQARRPWRGRVEIAWHEVQRLTFSPSTGCFMIRTADGRTLWAREAAGSSTNLAHRLTVV